MNTTEDVVLDILGRVLEEEGLEQTEIVDSSRLVDDLGFKSLHIARILAMLELEFDYDPFGSGRVPITAVRTVADLCAAYVR